MEMEGVLLYLGKHGCSVHILDLVRVFSAYPKGRITLGQLPPDLQLTSLQLCGLSVQLQPGGGYQGVLGAAATVAALKQLCIFCDLLGGPEAFLETLAQLPPGLQDLRFGGLDRESGYFYLPNAALQHLHNLTTLCMSNIKRASRWVWLNSASHAPAG